MASAGLQKILLSDIITMSSCTFFVSTLKLLVLFCNSAKLILISLSLVVCDLIYSLFA